MFERAGKEEVAYVYSKPVHYIVLTRRDNTFNMDIIEKYLAILDQIEASEAGPGVLVTIGTGDRHFSTGFDLAYWMQSYENMRNSLVKIP